MSDRKYIRFKFLYHGNSHEVEWPWQDYMALAYVLNTPTEAAQMNKGSFKLKFKEKCVIKFHSLGKKVEFQEAEEEVRHELGFHQRLGYESYSKANYPYLCKNIQDSDAYRSNKIFAEEDKGMVYVVFDMSVSDELDSIVEESHVSHTLGSGEDGGQSGAGVNPGRTSPGARSAGTDGKHSWQLGSKCTVTLVQKAAGKTDADVVLDIFETGKSMDFKLDRKGGVLKVQFPLLKYNFPSANSDLGIMFDKLLKEERPRRVALDIDQLKTWPTKHFIQNALKSILDYAKEEKAASLKFEMILCKQDIASFEQTAADIDKHIGEWTWFESLESGEDVTETDLMIEIKSGSLEKTKADALVCTMRGDLELNKAGASAALLRAAGHRLQTDLRKNYKYPNKLDYGDIAVVSGHDLDCRYVLLGVMNMYEAHFDERKEGPVKFYTMAVHDFMVRCLDKADELGLSSLAFPAVGCGSLDYPVDIVAQEMFTAVTEYRKDHPKSRINHVVFVIFHRDKEALQVFKKKENEFGQTRRRADVYDVDAGQDQPKQQPKSKASPAPNRKNDDDGSTCEKTSRQPTDQDEVNQLSDDLKKHKLEDSEESGLDKSKRSKMAHRQFSADSKPEDDEGAKASSYRLCLPRNVSNGVAEFFNSKLLHEYSKKGLKFKFGNGFLEYDGSENLRDSFEKKFKAKRDKISSELRSDSLNINSKIVGSDVFNKEFEAEGVYLEYDLETQTMTFYGKKWNDIRKVKQLYKAKFEDITRKRGDRHLDSGNRSVSSGTQTGSDGGARPKNSGATKQSIPNTTAFSWSEKTSDFEVYNMNKVTVKVYCADLLDVPVQCIVNAANTHLNHGGGVAKFIAKAAGQKFVKECDEYIVRRGPLKVGEACSTSAGDLQYSHVIHTVGPSWSYYKPYDLVSVQKCETDLDMAIRNSLSCAEKLGLTSVAIPAVSAGKFGCPAELCAVQYAKAVLSHVAISRNPVQEIHFVDKNSTMIKEIQKVFKVASKKGCIPKSYDTWNFVIPQASSAHAGHIGGSKGGGKPQTQSGTAADDSRWNTTYTESYSQHYPYCLPDRDLPDKGQIFTCFFSPTQKLLVYQGDILQTENIDMIACAETAKGNGDGYITKQLGFSGGKSFKTYKEIAFRGVKRGDVAVCMSGQNRFKYVAHAILYLRTDSKDKEERRRDVNSIFRKLIEAAVTRGCKTLALPLLGSGKGSADPVYYTERLVDSLHTFSSSVLYKGRTLIVHLVNKEQDKTRTAVQIIQAEITDMKAKSQLHRPPPARPPSAAHDVRLAPSGKRGRGGHHAAHRPRSSVGGHKAEAGGYPKSGHKYSMRNSEDSGSDDDSNLLNSFLNKNTGIETDFDNNRDMSRERDDKSRDKFSNSVLYRKADKEAEFASNREMTRSTKETSAQKKGNLKLFDDDEGVEQGDFKLGISEGVKNMSLSQRESKQGDTGRDMDESSGSEASETENCVICMDKLDQPKTLRCGHKFCKDCIEAQFKYKQACPTCGAVCGVITGDQPEGRMEYHISDRDCCAGYERYGRIQISYSFPNGVQQSHHPTPGRAYKGIRRSGFLPNNKKGKQILDMLQVAFDRKLVFTIGNSVTTGQQGVITWNDIHHKTDPKPNTSYGYPDPTYLERVVEELKAKGVTEADIPKAGNFSRSTRM